MKLRFYAERFLLFLFIVVMQVKVFSQGININLPVPIPPVIKNVCDNSNTATGLCAGLTPAGTGAVTVKANIVTFGAPKTDGSYATITNLVASAIKLCYVTDYDTNTTGPLSWTCNTMTIEGSPVSGSNIRTYTVSGTIPGQAAATKVNYAIQAEDDYTDANSGIGHSKVTMNSAPKKGAGWSTSWKNENTVTQGETDSPSSGSTGANETQTFFDPSPGSIQPNPATMDNNLDIITSLASKGNPGSGDALFLNLQVEGSVTPGSSDLSAANGYLYVVANMKRPFDLMGAETTDKVRGLFAILYFFNASQTSGIIPQTYSIVDLECTLALYDSTGNIAIVPISQKTTAAVDGAVSGNSLKVKTLLSNIDISSACKTESGSTVKQRGEITSSPLYDKDSVVLVGGAAVVDARDLTKPKFVINDVINGMRYYITGFSTGKGLSQYTVGSGGGQQDVCGDGTCGTTETASSCPADCTTSGPVCGNATCESGETATSCCSDCGTNCGGGTTATINIELKDGKTSIAITSGTIAVYSGTVTDFNSNPAPTLVTGKESISISGNPTAITGLSAGTYTLKITVGSYLDARAVITVTAGGSVTKTILAYKPTEGGDVSGDGKVDMSDFLQIKNVYGKKTGDANFDTKFDLNGDGKINLADIVILLKNYKP